jgi:hypothetical protein
MNELLEFSRRGFIQPLATAFKAMPRNKGIDSTRMLPRE